MWVGIFVIAMFFLLVAVLEGGLGVWADWAWRRGQDGQFGPVKRISQVVLISLLLGFVAWIIWWHWPAHREFYSW